MTTATPPRRRRPPAWTAQWLHARTSDAPNRRLAACLVLKELAEHAPSVFAVHTRALVARIWAALRDSRRDVRKAAAAALAAALRILERRGAAVQASKRMLSCS